MQLVQLVSQFITCQHKQTIYSTLWKITRNLIFNVYCLVPYLKEANVIVLACKEVMHIYKTLIAFTPHGEVSDHEFSSVVEFSDYT